MKKHYDLDLPPERRRKREKVGWMDLWVRIRFTRTQLLLFLLGCAALFAAIYVLVNFSSLQELLQRRRAVETIKTCRQLLSQLEDVPGARQDLIKGAQSQLEQAENALSSQFYSRAMSYAQQGIDLLEEELRWMKILETGRAAKFERIDGGVQVRRPGREDWEEAREDMEIEEESEIRTGKDGQARIRFDNGASSEITPDSLLIVRRLAIDPLNRTFENDVRLEQGEMEYRSQRRSDASQVDVPSGTFRSKGVIRVKAQFRQERIRPTAIEVLDGQGQFSDLKGNLVALAPMTRVNVDSSGTAAKARAILLAPEPIAPPTASSLRFVTKSPVVVLFRWSQVEGASGYQLEVAESSRFESLLKNIAAKDNQAKLTGLAEGIYWWRIRSVDEDGTKSDPGTYRSFRVQISEQGAGPQTEGPKVDFARVKFISRNSVLVEGKTTFGVQLFVNDQPISVELNGKFRDIVVIKGQGNTIAVEAIDPDGNISNYPLEVQQ